MTKLTGRDCALVGTLFLLVFVMGVDSFVIAPLLVPIARSYQVTVGAATGGVTLYALCYALGAPFFGPLGDKYAKRRLLLSGTVGFLVGNLICALAPNLGWFDVARAVSGLSAALTLPNVWATIGGHFRGRQLTIIMGVTMAALSLAIALGVPLGTAVAQVTSWHGIFWGAAGVTGGLLGLLSWVLPRVPGQARPLRYGANFKRVLTAPHTVATLGVTLIWMLGFYGLYTFLGPTLMQHDHLTTAVTGLVFMVYGFSNFAASFFSGYLTNRVGALHSVICAGLLSAGSVLGMVWLAPDGLSLVGWLSGLAVAQGWGVTALSAYLVRLVPQRSTIMALNSAVLYLGLTLGSSLGGWLYQRWALLGVGGLAILAFSLASGLAARLATQKGR